MGARGDDVAHHTFPEIGDAGGRALHPVECGSSWRTRGSYRRDDAFSVGVGSAVRMPRRPGARTRDAPRPDEGSPAMNGPNSGWACRFFTLVAVALMASAAVAGCGGDDDDATTTTTGSSPSICEDVDRVASRPSRISATSTWSRTALPRWSPRVSAVEDDAEHVDRSRRRTSSDRMSTICSRRSKRSPRRFARSSRVAHRASPTRCKESRTRPRSLTDKIDDEKCD